MEFLAAMKTIRRMHEQCACGPKQQIETGKPLCPLYTTAFPCTDIFLYTDDSIIEKIIQKWDAENPAPQYPTWADWLVRVGVLGCETRHGHDYHFVENAMFKPIPADMAQKLGIEPEEENRGT